MKERKKWSSAAKLKLWTGISLLALGSALVVFMVLLQVEKKAMETEDTRSAYIVTKRIERGTVVEDWERSGYVKKREIPVSCIPENQYPADEKIGSGRVLCSLEKNTVLCTDMVETPKEETKEYKRPVIVCVESADLTGTVSGILKNGDRVNLFFFQDGSMVDEMDHVLIQQVFDANGKALLGTEKQECSLRFNIYLEEEKAGRFYELQQAGKIRVAQVVQP